MRKIMNDRNLYMLQVGNVCLWHNDDACKSPKKVPFDEDKRFGLEWEIVVPSPKSHCEGKEFDHIIAHVIS